MISKGQIISDRYVIIKNIGEGGMANVYLAHDNILNRDVAVKVLRGDLAGDEKFVRRFQREAISASSLTHPNIVEMYDVGEDHGKYFIVMEHIEGRTLKSLIKRRGYLTVLETVDIMIQITSGIACAHDSYIIHRDLKPQNILVLEDGTAKITDFGIAMALNSNELTQTNSIMGSVHYLPPEQANGKLATVKSDIYSLGIMMYEMLIGKVPFKGDNAVEIAIKQIKEQIPSVREINNDIPQSIENIILKATAKNPKNRYDNVLEMKKDLEDALKEEHLNDNKLVYMYPEHEIIDEKTKVVPTDEIKKELNEEVNEDIFIESPKKSKLTPTIWILSIISILLATLFIIIIIIYPALRETKEVSIKNVSGLEIEEAIDILEEQGLIVIEETIKRHSNEIEIDKVITTDPKPNSNIKVGSKVTIYVSLGTSEVEIDNYIGKNYIEIKKILEDKGLNVLIEKKEVEDKNKYKKNIIIEQDKKNVKVEKGDTITLTIQELITYYPDFTKYTVDKVKKFCSEHNVELEIEYVPSEEESNGTIIYQNYTAGVYKVLDGSSQIVRIKVVDNSAGQDN